MGNVFHSTLEICQGRLEEPNDSPTCCGCMGHRILDCELQMLPHGDLFGHVPNEVKYRLASGPMPEFVRFLHIVEFRAETTN